MRLCLHQVFTPLVEKQFREPMAPLAQEIDEDLHRDLERTNTRAGEFAHKSRTLNMQMTSVYSFSFCFVCVTVN